MSLSLTALLAALTMRRRQDDDPEQDRAIARYAKQVAPMVAVALLTGAGVQLGPMGRDVSDGRDDLHKVVTAVTRLEERMGALDARVTDISTRRAAQVEDLEKRVRVCEIQQAATPRPR